MNVPKSIRIYQKLLYESLRANSTGRNIYSFCHLNFLRDDSATKSIQTVKRLVNRIGPLYEHYIVANDFSHVKINRDIVHFE